MAAELTKIRRLESKQPLFREFCKINGLKDGDFFKAIDYIFWVDRLPLTKQLEINRKYKPDFKLKNCNL